MNTRVIANMFLGTTPPFSLLPLRGREEGGEGEQPEEQGGDYSVGCKINVPLRTVEEWTVEEWTWTVEGGQWRNGQWRNG